MYEGVARNSMLFSEITDRMYASQKIDGTFSALGKAVGDDYKVSDRAFGKTAASQLTESFWVSIVWFVV